MEDCGDTTAGGPVLSDAQFAALMVEVHEAIEEAAEDALSALGGGQPDLIYPAGITLSDEERAALAAVEPSTALGKVIANAAAQPMFRLFSLLDGLADPEDIEEFWPPWELVPSEDGELFYENWLAGRRD
jgi:hypothetical protein